MKKFIDFIGKNCTIHIIRKDKDLFYTAKIIYMNDTHIEFIDKFNEFYLYKLTDVIEISNVG